MKLNERHGVGIARYPPSPRKRLNNRNYNFKLNTKKQHKFRQYRTIVDCTLRGLSHHALWDVMNRSRTLRWLWEYSTTKCCSVNSSLDAKHGLSLFDLYSAPRGFRLHILWLSPLIRKLTLGFIFLNLIKVDKNPETCRATMINKQ